MKEKSEYKLKNGVLLKIKDKYGDIIDVTNANITTKIAEKYLKQHPDDIKFFAVYPENWKDRVFGKGIKNFILTKRKLLINIALIVFGTTLIVVIWTLFKNFNVSETQRWVVGTIIGIIGLILAYLQLRKNK